MCEPGSRDSTVKEGYLKKRPRGRTRPVGPKAEFKRRFFRLTDEKLEYWNNKKKSPKGCFEVENIRVIEEVDKKVFGTLYSFLIASEKEYMYIAAYSQLEKTQWMEALRQVVQQKGVDMLPFYHCGFHDKNWTCCDKVDPLDKGCTPTGSLASAYEESGESYEWKCQSNASSSTLKRKSKLSESFSSSSTLKSQSTHQSFSSDDYRSRMTSFMSSTQLLLKNDVSEKDLIETKERTGSDVGSSNSSDVSTSGIGSRTSSAVSSFSRKSEASAQSGSSSTCDSVDSVLQSPQNRTAKGTSCDEDYISDTSSSTLRRNPMLSESLSSSSTLKLQDASLSLSIDDPSHQSPTKSPPEIEVHEEGLLETRRRTDSGMKSETNSAISSFSGKSGTSVLSGLISRCESMYDVPEKPQPTWGTETNDGDKQRSAHPLSKHHQLQGCKSLHLKTVVENTDKETNGSSEILQEVKHHEESNAASASIKVAEQPITAVAFLSFRVVVYATKDHHVCIFDIPKGKLLYDVKLTHPVSTLDVWNEKYILVGSSPVQLFEMKADRLRTIVVMDPEDNSDLMATSSYLCAFLSSDCFATASEMGNEVLLWPVPTEDKSIIIEVLERFPVGNSSERIYSMRSSGDSERLFLAIAKQGSTQIFAVKVYDCSDHTCIKEVRLTKFEERYLTLETSGRMEVERKYGSSVCTIGRSQTPKAHIPVALDDGTIVLFDNLTSDDSSVRYVSGMEEHSNVSSLVSMEENGSTLIAAGYKNGSLELWGGDFEMKLEYDVIEEIFTTQVFLGDSFYQESLLYDYYEFTADFNGGKFENYPSYSLEIPRGAIPEGEKVVIRTGILKYGPCGLFECPKGVSIVSPIVWFCSNDHNFQFLKPAILEMQHCSNTPESLVLLKAGHDNRKGIHDVFNFQVQTSPNKCSSNRYFHNTEIAHFCLYCYGVSSSDDGIQRGFCLIPVERAGYMERTHQVTFCLSYDLNSCKQAVKEQYPSSDYRIKQPLPVHFQGGAQVNIDYPHEKCGWLISKTCPGHMIGLEDLIWEQKFPTKKALVSAHKNNKYPPRFILELCGKNAKSGVTITVSLTNVVEPVSYDITLYMPCELEEGQEEMRVCPCSQGLSDDSGILIYCRHV